VKRLDVLSVERREFRPLQERNSRFYGPQVHHVMGSKIKIEGRPSGGKKTGTHKLGVMPPLKEKGGNGAGLVVTLPQANQPPKNQGEYSGGSKGL